MSSASRNSSGSARSPRHRQVNLSTIEKSVTHLLVATKQLLETLTAWSRQQASEAEVSDVYVRLGSEFNVACRAFTAIGVETADLGNVPDALRTILENTLSQDASPQSLDVYLPRIREIIINLLHGLKRKQQKLRQKQQREAGEGSGSGSERSSTASTRSRSGDVDPEMAPPRTSSLPAGPSPRMSGQSISGSVRASTSTTASARSHGHNGSVSSVRSSPPPANGTPAAEPGPPPPPKIEESPASPPSQYFPPPPPPPPPSQDALTALQQHSSLERRASRRYSAYQIAKLTGKNPNDVPVLPSRDPSATPRNRESMDAVRKRQSARSKSTNRNRDESSPMRHTRRISEEKEADVTETPLAKTPEEKLKTSEEKLKPVLETEEPDQRQPAVKVDPGASPPTSTQPESGTTPAGIPSSEEPRSTTLTAPSDVTRRSSSPSGKELTVFLQLGRSIKKVVLSDGIEELSMTSLRLLFISKFNYNPPSGDDFPEIYLQDPVSGVRYELEDLRDVKDRAVLCLNIEVLDEVKRHIDDGMGDIKQLVTTLAGSVQAQSLQINRVAERQEEAAKKIAELSVTGPISSPPPAPSSGKAARQLSPEESAVKLNEIRDLRKDLAVLRQVYATFVADMNTSMTTIKTKAKAVKQVAASAVGPNEGRAYVEAGKKTLGGDADNLVTKVDDLQDIVEDLRKDVVQRGVRPLPRQLEEVSRDIALARTELKKMSDYIKREKPTFRRVWERELEVVCEEQEFFNMQENLIADLQDDLDKASQTFTLVEQCSDQQMKTTTNGVKPRGLIGILNPDEQLAPEEAKDSVLSEVRALQPNHESRLEAIERAEKLRQRELAGRVPEFQKELGKFVAENRLKKAGGFEEAERLRMTRDESNRKAIWEYKKKLEEEAEESSSEEESDDEDEDEDGGAAAEAPAAASAEAVDTAEAMNGVGGLEDPAAAGDGSEAEKPAEEGEAAKTE